MKQKPTLVIIPGIGDDLKVYKTFARRWERLGYNVHVISFGWAERSAKFSDKVAAFLKRFDQVATDETYIIGVSAGGPAAVYLLSVRTNVYKIITVCSPLDTMVHLRNPLLAESIEQARLLLANFGPAEKQRILSVLALHDRVVSTGLSRPDGIRTLRVAMVVHPAAIFVALMFYARRLSTFFRD